MTKSIKFKQEFTNMAKEYRYNPNTMLVEEIGERDLQEEINSCCEATIDELFDKLLYTGKEKKVVEEKRCVREYCDKLDLAQKALDDFNNAKRELGVDLALSETEFNAVLEEKKKDINKKIKTMSKNVKISSDKIKENKEDEKKIDQKG